MEEREGDKGGGEEKESEGEQRRDRGGINGLPE